jgi:colanic acid biosynthesis glycosyl transferase WcaI
LIKQLILLTQVYPPDAAAVGQYFEELAVRLGREGRDVVVYTADRDYDDPSVKYDARSRHPKVVVKRLPWSSFGKKTILHRLVGQASFLLQCFFRLLFARRVDSLVLTTIPATTGAMVALLLLFRRFKVLYWVMDLNPDQAVAMKVVRPGSLAERLLNRVNRRLLRKAEHVVVLDDFMAARIRQKLPDDPDLGRKLAVIPPWPLEGMESDSEGFHRPAVRRDFGFPETGRLFMYSGNHSLVHPLDGLLAGIVRSPEGSGGHFAFVGGGRAKQAVEAAASGPAKARFTLLPYQPLEKVPALLSSADIHLVAMGTSMVGIVHPCKIYGALAASRPVLLYGPRESALGELVAEHNLGWIIEPEASPEEVGKALEEILQTSDEVLTEMGKRGRRLIETDFQADRLAGKLCSLLRE